MDTAERSFNNPSDCPPPYMRTSGIQPSQQRGKMWAPLYTHPSWNQQPSGNGSNTSPPSNGLQQLVLTEQRAKDNSYNYVSMHHSQLQFRPSLHTGQGASWSGSIANGSHSNGLPVYAQALPFHFSSAAPPEDCRWTAVSLNNQSPVNRTGHCVGPSNQDLQQNAVLGQNHVKVLPSIGPNSQIPGINNGVQSLFLPHVAVPVAQRPVSKLLPTVKTVAQGQVPAANALCDSPDRQSEKHCWQQSAYVAPGSMFPYQQFMNTQGRSLDTPSAAGSSCSQRQNANAVCLLTNTDQRLRFTNVGQVTVNSQQMANCGQKNLKLFCGTVTRVHGDGTSTGHSSLVQRNLAQKLLSMHRSSGGNSLEKPQETNVRRRTSFPSLLALPNEHTRKYCVKNGTVNVSRVEDYSGASHKNSTIPELPLQCANPTFSLPAECSNIVGVQYSGSGHLQSSSRAQEKPCQILSRIVGGSMPQSSGVTQQHGSLLPTMASWPSISVQPPKQADNFQSIGARCENVLPLNQQNQELLNNRNNHVESSVFSQMVAAHGTATTGSVPGVQCTSSQPLPSTSRNKCTSYPSIMEVTCDQRPSLSNQARHSCSQPCSDKTVDSSYQQRKGYFVTVTEDKQGNGFTAEKVIPVGNLPRSYAERMERIQMLSTEENAEVRSGKTSTGGFSYINDPEKNATQPSAVETSCPAGHLQLHSANSQQSVAAAVQRAVAVVPPISQQQNCNHLSDVTSTDEETLKIKNVYSLSQTEPSCVSSTTLPDETASGEKSLTDTMQTSPALVLDEPQLSNQQSLGTAEKSSIRIACTSEVSCSNLNSRIQSNVSTEKGGDEIEPNIGHENDGGQEVYPKEGAFDLSTVPVVPWTAGDVYDLIGQLENVSRLCEPEVNRDMFSDILRLFWGDCVQNLFDAVRTDTYKTIFDFWRVQMLENPIIFSQVSPLFMKKLEENCHILEHDVHIPCPTESVCESSLLNLSEKVDALHEDNGFSPCLRPGIQTPKRISKQTESDETRKYRQADTFNETTNVDIPQEPALSQTDTLPPSVEACDPLSLLKITVLTLEEAKAFFCLELSKSGMKEDLQDEKTPAGMDEASEDGQVNSYCCISRWVEVVGRFEEKSLCKCQSGLSKENQETAIVKEYEEKEDVLTEHCIQESSSPALQASGTWSNQTKLNFEELCIENDTTVDEQSPVKAVVVQQPCLDNNASVNVSFSGCEKSNMMTQEASENVGENKVLKLKTQEYAAVRSDLNIVEVMVENVHSDVGVALKEVATMSQQLGTKHISSLQVSSSSDLDKSDSSETVAKCIHFRNVEMIPKEDTINGQQVPNVVRPVDTSGESTSLSFEPKFSCKQKEKNTDMISSFERHRGKEPFLLSESTLHSNLKQNIKGSVSPSSQSRMKEHVNQNNNKPFKKIKKFKKKKIKILSSDASKTFAGKDRKSKDKSKKLQMRKLMQEKPTVSRDNTVRLALYGSSNQREKGGGSSSRGQPDHLQQSFQPLPGKPISPPKTISLKLLSQESEFGGGNGDAKLRVYNSWHKSLVQNGRNGKSRHFTSMLNSQEKKQLPKGSGNNEKKEGNRKTRISSDATGRGATSQKRSRMSSQNEHVTNLTNGNKHMKDANGTRHLTVDSASRTVQRKGKHPVKSSRVPDPGQITAAPYSEKDKPSRSESALKRKAPQSRTQSASKRPHSVLGEFEYKTKYNNGNPALMPLANTEKTLQFKVLPESFDFQQCKLADLTAKSSNKLENIESHKRTDENTRRQKMVVWDMKGQRFASTKKKNVSCSETTLGVSSPAAQSRIAYEHYKKRYLSKLKK